MRAIAFLRIEDGFQAATHLESARFYDFGFTLLACRQYNDGPPNSVSVSGRWPADGSPRRFSAKF